MSTQDTPAAEPAAAAAPVGVTYVGPSAEGVHIKLAGGWTSVEHGGTVEVTPEEADALLAQGEENWVAAGGAPPEDAPATADAPADAPV